MSSYGYAIVQVLVTDILPDAKVRCAIWRRHNLHL